MKEFLIFGDIAGRYDEMRAILNVAPDCMPISVGDMNDRGPKSKEVLEFFMKNGRAVLGNHEHMFLDWVNEAGFYQEGIWGSHMNGAFPTMQSFGLDNCLPVMKRENIKKVKLENQDLINWLMDIPLFLEGDDYIITHAAINPVIGLEKCCNINVESFWDIEDTVLWNRGRTRPRKDGKFQIHGHMAYSKAHFLEVGHNKYGINLDSSRGEKLTAMHWPSLKLFEQDYLS